MALNCFSIFQLSSTRGFVKVTRATKLCIKCSRACVEPLSALHKFTGSAILHLAHVAMTDLECITKDGKELVCRFVLPSYIGVILECEDHLLVKRGIRTTYPCHSCMTEKRETQKFTNCQWRDWSKTKHLFESMNSNDVDAEAVSDNLNEMSLLSISPVLWKLTFVEVSVCVDIYVAYLTQPMHLFPLGMGCMLIECLCILLGDYGRSSVALKTFGDTEQQTFRALFWSIERDLNTFM